MGYCGPRGIPLSTFLSWPQEDQDAALAWQGYENQRCGSCGHHPDEGGVHAHLDVCPGCVARESRQQMQDVRDTRGGHVRIAHGSPATCKRCLAEAAANS